MKRVKLSLIFLFALLFVFSTVAFAYPITVTDSTGTTITIDKEPARIVSCAPSNTEIIFALGRGDKLVGVTNYADYPKEAKKIEKIGKMSPLNAEKILSLKPDIVFCYGGFQLKEALKLRDLGLKVVIFEPKSVEETLKTISIFGEILNARGEADKLIKDFNKRLKVIKEKVRAIPQEKRPKVFIGSMYEPIYSPGKGTFLDELITIAGGRNIVTVKGWSKISPEFVIKANPDVVVIPVGVMSMTDLDSAKKKLSQKEVYKNLKATKEGRIYFIDENLVFRPGPRLIDGIEKLYSFFYEK